MSALGRKAVENRLSYGPARASRRSAWPTRAYAAAGDVGPAPAGNPTQKSGASGREAWPNEASEHRGRAPTPCASPLSVSLATMWGLLDEGQEAGALLEELGG